MAIPTVTRAALVRGPARHLFNGASCYTRDDFGIDLKVEKVDVTTSGHGMIDQSILRYLIEMSINSDGQWDAATIAAFWPYMNALPGASCATASDVPWVVHCANTEKYTIIAAVITKLADITLGVSDSKIGSMTVTGVIGDNKAPGDADCLMKIEATGGTFAQASPAFTPAVIKNQAYSAVWGAVAGFTAFQAQDKWTISFSLKLAPVIVQGVLRDFTFQGLEVMAKCIPVGPTAAQIAAALKYQDTGMVPGMSAYGLAAQLQITGADTINYVTIPKAALVGAGYRFGGTVLRAGEVGFVGLRPFSTGAQSALCTLAAPA